MTVTSSRPLDDVTLQDGRSVELLLGDMIVGGGVDMSVESSLALTFDVHSPYLPGETDDDPQRSLLTLDIFDRNENGRLDIPIIVKLEDRRYTLSSIRKTGDRFSLAFEDALVARLRQEKGTLRRRSKTESHVQFARRLVQQVGGEFVTPTGKARPDTTTTLKAKQARVEADERRERGIADGANLTVKGKQATAEQKRNMDTVLSIAEELNAGPKATLALVEACIVESLFRNLTYGDKDSIGILQLRVSLHGRQNAASINRSVRLFLTKGFTGKGGAISLARQNPSWSAGQVAQAVQGSAFPGRYDEHRQEGRRIIEAYGGASPGGDSTSASSGPGAAGSLSRGKDESSWDALTRIAGEHGYRCFAYRNRVHYVREQDLILSRPRLTISEQSQGVDWIDWEWTPGKRINQATVACRASMWAAPPGSVVVLENCGPADGRWLVSSFKRSWFARDDASIELRRGSELLTPPERETTTSKSAPRTNTPAQRGAPASKDQQQIKLTSAWGGAQAVFAEFIDPFMAGKGLRPGSRKRPYNTGTGISDHWVGSKKAYATDYPTFKGEAAARALAKALGNPNWQPNSYATFNVRISGATFRVQILWGAGVDHGDHVHVGLRRVG